MTREVTPDMVREINQRLIAQPPSASEKDDLVRETGFAPTPAELAKAGREAMRHIFAEAA